MAEDKRRRPSGAEWRRQVPPGTVLELLLLTALGAVAYLLFLQAGRLRPIEGALLVMAAAGLLRLGLRWWDWQAGLSREGVLLDWLHGILRGERRVLAEAAGLSEADRQTAEALNRLLTELQAGQEGLTALQRAVGRDWRELDALLEAVQHHREADAALQAQGAARLQALGLELKAALEDTLRLDQIELNQRLRADQHRLLGQSFRSALDHVQAGLEQFETLLEELQDSFPRLRREEDALGRLADAGLRQGARLSLAVKGLGAHAPRLVNEAQERIDWIRRFRHSADNLRDRSVALARRMEGFREEAQVRIRSFSGTRGTVKGLDHVAQQTGLLAVNAAILAQQGGGSAGMMEIGGRLRTLADLTAEGASEMDRSLGQYQQGLEREATGIWDLQEVTEQLLSSVHELLRMAGHLDQQGHELERALETQVGLVDQVREATERAELSLHEIRERSLALESAHGRQWGVEAKLLPERARLSRLSTRLGEVGGELARTSQQNIDVIWDVVTRFQEVRRTESYRRATSGELHRLVPLPDHAELAWRRLAWTRAQRHPRLVEALGELPPAGRRSEGGMLHLLLLGQDALDAPEPSALATCSCDATGRIWSLGLLPTLRTESHRLGLIGLLRESPLLDCFPGLEMRITPEGAEIRLPSAYPGMARFLAGLRLELPLEAESWDHPFRDSAVAPTAIQRLVWIGPGPAGGPNEQSLNLIHEWVRDDPQHESFLPWLPYAGHRPPCALLERGDHEADAGGLSPVRCLGLGADEGLLHPLRDRLLRSGASEGFGGLVLCAVGVSHPHPEALLLRLFQQGAELAGAFHPDLVPYQIRMRDQVLAGSGGDPYRAAWSILEDLQRERWLMPLPPD